MRVLHVDALKSRMCDVIAANCLREQGQLHPYRQGGQAWKSQACFQLCHETSFPQGAQPANLSCMASPPKPGCFLT